MRVYTKQLVPQSACYYNLLQVYMSNGNGIVRFLIYLNYNPSVFLQETPSQDFLFPSRMEGLKFCYAVS